MQRLLMGPQPGMQGASQVRMLVRLGAASGIGLAFVALAACGKGPPDAIADDAASAPTADGGPASEDHAAPATDADAAAAAATDAASAAVEGRGFPAAGPWVSFYGPAQGLDIAKIASTFRIINIDVDPGAGNVTGPQITAFGRSLHQNGVIDVMGVGP